MASDAEKRPANPTENVSSGSQDTHTGSDTHGHSNKPVVDEDGSQPFSSGFWDKDPVTTKARKEYLKIAVGSALMISVAIFCVLSIYWGALWKTESLVHHLNGWVVVSPNRFIQ